MEASRRFMKRTKRKLGFFGRRAVRYYLNEGQKILAIKEVRKRIGFGLKEAKAYVDNL